MTYSRELEEYYVEQYRCLHTDPSFIDRGWIYGYGDGKATADKMSHIKSLVDKYGAKSLLDYGCGKAIHHVEKKLYDEIGMYDVELYDPAVDKYSTLTGRILDCVVCVDVLEHIPEDNLDHTLGLILSKAKMFVFFAISCNPSRDILKDGSNAHVTLREPGWWVEKLSNHEVPIYAVMSHGKRKNTMFDIKAGSCHEV